MKKLITIMVACSLAVVIHLKTGEKIRADRVYRYLNNAVIVEINNRNVQDRLVSKTHVYVPNANIIRIVETD